VLSIERLLLETVCFNFTSRMPFPYVMKLGKALGASKKLTKLAWRLTIDCHRTLVPLQYPPHIVALAGVYIAALLLSFEQPVVNDGGPHTAHEIADILGKNGDWEQKYQAQVDDLEGIAHTVIDLLIQGAQSQTLNTSPRTPSSPSPHPSPRTGNPHPLTEPQPQAIPYNADQLIRLKIAMRATEHPPRTRQPLGSADPSALYNGDDVALLGRSEGTVRFLFGPPGAGSEF